MNKFNFGPYEGQTFDEIASTQEGLLYLDSMVEALKKNNTFYNNLVKYLSKPKVAEKIEEAVDSLNKTKI